MPDGVVADVGVAEHVKLGTPAEQRVHADDFESGEPRRLSVGRDFPRAKILAEMRAFESVVGRDLDALDAEGAHIRQVMQMVEGRQGEIGKGEAHGVSPVLRRRR